MSGIHFPGAVHGQAGRSLDGAGQSWAANDDVARIGQESEVRSAQILNQLTLLGPSVLHDLRIPGSRANIDHVVVSGDRVLLLDTKRWAPGHYWTFRGRTRIGFGSQRTAASSDVLLGAAVPHCDKRTLPMAKQALEGYFERLGVPNVKVLTPALIVWSSGELRFWGYRPQGGAAVVRGEHLGAWLQRKVPPSTASNIIVNTLMPLSN